MFRGSNIEDLELTVVTSGGDEVGRSRVRSDEGNKGGMGGRERKGDDGGFCFRARRWRSKKKKEKKR